MNIAVLNGSPKGERSFTIQHVKYLQKKFSACTFQFYNVAQEIRQMENNANAFAETINKIANSDAVLWASPVFYFLVPSQYKRFIELIFERGAQEAFRGKYTAAITTSIHILDHTAHNYINSVCDDLQMNFIDFYSGEPNDLYKEKERIRLQTFGEFFFRSISGNLPTIKYNKPLQWTFPDYKRNPIKPINTDKKVLIVVDNLDGNSSLHSMVEDLQYAFNPQAELVQLKDINIKGGCLGCLHCAADNHCVYEGKDDFNSFFNNHIRNADILFFAGAIKDRFLSATWKCFLDRSFFMGHVPVLEDKQIGYIIDGPLDQLFNLREWLTAYAAIQHANMIGIVSNDTVNQEEINLALASLINSAVLASQLNYTKPPTFLKVGTNKLFRDVMLSGLQEMFQADDRYYKSHGYYENNY